MTWTPVVYSPPHLPGMRESTGNHTRKLCGYMAAWAAYAKDRNQLGGPLKGLTPEQQTQAFINTFAKLEVDAARRTLWCYGIEGRRLGGVWASHRGMQLDPYQKESAERLTVAGGVLAFGVGLGKTLTTVAAARSYQSLGYASNSRCWIVCPLNAFPAWKPWVDYLKLFFADVQIISMDSLHKMSQGLRADGGVIIFDEAHQLGEDTARRTKAAHQVRACFDVGLCLTGTLLHGGIHKALSVLDLAVPGMAGFGNPYSAAAYFKCLGEKKVGSKTYKTVNRPEGEHKKRFQDWLSHYVISLTKESPSVRSSVTIPEQLLYTQEFGDCSQPIDKLAADILQRRMQEDGEIPHAQEIAHLLMRDGIDQKIEWLMDALDGETQQVVVFAQYTDSLDKIEVALAEAGVTVCRVDGSTSSKLRIEYEKHFREDIYQVFLGQITAASVSMNLQTAKISVAVDVNWKASDYAQALGRTCRRGSTDTCHHFDLVANRLQKYVVQRLRDSQDFDSSLAEYQELKRVRDTYITTNPTFDNLDGQETP